MRTCLAILLTISLAGCGDSVPPRSQTPAEVAEERAEQEQQAAAAEAQRQLDERHGSEGGAMLASESYVRQFLKFPKQAEFGWSKDTLLSQPLPSGQRNWLVTGTVEAPNSFGMTITHNWQVALFLRNSTWTPLLVIIDDEVMFKDAEETASVAAEVAAHQAAAELAQQQAEEAQRKADKLAADQARIDARKAKRAGLRTWTSSAGTTIEAEFVSFGAGTVKLRKADESVISVPLAKLSADDQAFVRRGR